MANIKISELNPLVTVQDADVLPIVDNAVTKKVTAAILRSYTQGNSVLLTGAQTIAGIKTFTSQIASSVATGTAPFSVASTTKVTNLNADLLDGLSSADFALSTRTLTAGTGLTGGGDLTANRTFAIDSTVATLTGTQTLTNKTITSPVINEILDSNGNEILGFTPIASATDYITIKNGIGVGVPLHISAAGSSTNTGLHLEPKGTGLVQISDGTDTTKGFRFRSSASATGAVTLIDAVSSAGRVITLPNATGTVALTSDLTSYVPTTRTVSTTSPLAGGGALSGDLTLSIPQASGSVNGYLASTDFATFNAKQNAITLTTTGTSGAATLVGSTLNIPNYADTDTGITSLNGLTALTQTFAVGTSGTDFGISSATSTHTFNLPTASATNRGALSSADWTTFNNKQNALTNPITGTGTTNYLPKFTGASALGNSLIFDSGTGVGVNTNTPASKLQVEGSDYSFIAGSDAGNRRVLIGLDTSGEPSIQGTLSNGTARQISINPSGGNVGIGTTSPASILETKEANRSNSSNITNVGIYTTSAQDTGVGGTIGFGGLFTASDYAPFASIRGAKENNINENYAGYLAFQTIQNGGSLSEKMRIVSGGNVLIGTTTDAGYKLDVNGTARVSGAATFSADATINGVTVGRGAGNIASNTAVGVTALNATTIGIKNTAIGALSMFSNTTGNNNTAIGRASLYTNVSGDNNTAIGVGSLDSNTVSGNTAVGFEAGYNNTSGSITAIGYQAGKANTTGAVNTALGSSALLINTTGSANTAIGAGCLEGNTTGSHNTAIGRNANSGNFDASVILGRDATATASNQFVVGSPAYNAGAVATEVNASSKVWNVIINGVAQKILLA